MKNADMPAMPVKNANFESDHFGLTKREMIAMHAMQGFISGHMAWSDGLDGGSADITPQSVAGVAVEFADALLRELNTQPLQ